MRCLMSTIKRIVLAGGCFWGVQEYFNRLKGVVTTTVGYVNGNMENPKYEDLIQKRATHAEAVEIYYDVDVITLSTLLEHMFRFIDPTSLNRQGGDVGLQYRTGVYYQEDSDKEEAIAFLKRKQAEYDKMIVVEVVKEVGYFLAEEYHQDYLKKNPTGYCHVNLNLIKKDEKK